MNYTKTLLKLIHIALMCIAITACSETTKTVQWEEEVPLNTGEVIWVKRADTYSRRSEPGNPLKMGWWLEKRLIEFVWQAERFKFQTDTTEILMLHVLDASKNIAVIAWAKNCSKRGYGEYRWIDGNWQLQTSINNALIGHHRNLMGYSSANDGDIPLRVTQEWIRSQHFELPQKGSSEMYLLASRIAANCTGSK
ncbi:MAG TPA: hypothetical protein PLH13_05500 [Burkholderiaceae bacterium]|nr:hypothetical protein [Burkholderiaceae bacterium]HRH05525.1 hypothetical protein [Burkholderiaceae bacterium]